MVNGADSCKRLQLVYYCSGHGYGHATRVSALARHLLSLDSSTRPIVHIVSSAPQHVFADSIACGARYRSALIDPVIVQPLAYRVDRQKSVDVLKAFLAQKDELLERERKWLLDIGAHAILSDAAFLGCLAAKAAGLPSILITNFSFDSVYSYLSTAISDGKSTGDQLHPDLGGELGMLDALVPDTPIPWAELEPLVEQIHSGYRCADLLVLLPGAIPMPSFFKSPSLPASKWVDTETLRMHSHIIEALSLDLDAQPLLPPIPFSPSGFIIPRKVIPAPLLVRTPNVNSDVCSPEGRSRFLRMLGVPEDRHGPDTKILVVSFGGQNFHQPSRQGSRTHSRQASRESLDTLVGTPKSMKERYVNKIPSFTDLNGNSPPRARRTPPDSRNASPLTRHTPLDIDTPKTKVSGRLATESHLWLPGAPPAFKSYNPATGLLTPALTPNLSPRTPLVIPATPTPGTDESYFDVETLDDFLDEPMLLPDDSWIAIVCGVTKAQWVNPGEAMPEGFYVAPKDVYMPDLTLIADVLLGKLGYGTVAECVDSCTPFVYVSRPLFVEEHGLRLLLDKDGVGVELLRECYEAGDWANGITEAYEMGKAKKERKRIDVMQGIDLDKRDVEGQQLAKTVIAWVREWDEKMHATQDALGVAEHV